MGNLTNLKDPDEIRVPYFVAFHAALFLKTKSIFIGRNKICLESITCDSSIHIMDYSELTVSNCKDSFSVLKRAKVDRVYPKRPGLSLAI